MSGRTSVATFVGTRADLGPLGPVLTALAEAADLDLTVLTGVAWTRESLTSALAAALPAPDEPWRVVALADPVTGPLDAGGVVRHGPALSAGAGSYFLDARPDVLVVLGDRWELLYVVPQAVLAGMPVVHLHGGEVTEGAVDERVRHAVTKLADQHCVASRGRRRPRPPARRIRRPGARHRGARARPVRGPTRPDGRRARHRRGPRRRPPAGPLHLPPPDGRRGCRRAGLGNRRAARHRRPLRHGRGDPSGDGCRSRRRARRPGPGCHRPTRRRPGEPRRGLPGRPRRGGRGRRQLVVGGHRGRERRHPGRRRRRPAARPAARRQRGPRRGGRVCGGVGARGRPVGVAPRRSAQVVNPYGDGRAAARVVEVVRAAPAAPLAKQFVDVPEAT